MSEMGSTAASWNCSERYPPAGTTGRFAGRVYGLWGRIGGGPLVIECSRLWVIGRTVGEFCFLLWSLESSGELTGMAPRGVLLSLTRSAFVLLLYPRGYVSIVRLLG